VGDLREIWKDYWEDIWEKFRKNLGAADLPALVPLI
jgi:hypothetical protein